jgi:RNA polymerase-interacting CarD/CdnL/TRCF family regulator
VIKLTFQGAVIVYPKLPADIPNQLLFDDATLHQPENQLSCSLRLRKEKPVNLSIGSKVIYPSQGPCLIDSVVNKECAGKLVSFYRLALLDDSGGDLFVPVEKVQTVGLRPLLNKSEIPELLGRLMIPGQTAKDWKQRAQINLKLLASGSAFDLAEVVESLTKLNQSKLLSFRENQVLERAKRLLICEISEVLGETKIAAEEQINSALNAQRVV